MRQVGIPFGKHKHVVVEDLQVLRYEVDQHYHTHHDYFDPKLHHGFLQVPYLMRSRISCGPVSHVCLQVPYLMHAWREACSTRGTSDRIYIAQPRQLRWLRRVSHASSGASRA